MHCETEKNIGSLDRGPRLLGPMRRIWSAPACAVYGTDAESEAAARFLANMQVMTGHGHLQLIPVSEALNKEGQLAPPESCQHLVVIGDEASNPAVTTLMRSRQDLGFRAPVTSGTTTSGSRFLDVGGCQWGGPDVAVLALLPWWVEGDNSKIPRLALLVTGTSSSTAAAEALTLLSTPTIPPMARQPLTHLLPDYVVLDLKKTRAHGPGGFLAAGFWNHRWQHHSRTSWEHSCRNLDASETKSQKSEL
eukprot:TRINITY_DN12216_c0_g2_i1.p1 TRINITY_DN12216_c0_g2~~TRINITY_DN12216_c0_g2_i1.p1  ORF type:complete len:249 (-),score=41.31 TRINITY_DN12216_c0_g2_i1:125-871(-)